MALSNAKYYLDIAIPEAMVAIEFDGTAEYGSDAVTQRAMLEQERQRECALAQAGWEVVRFRWDHLQIPLGVTKMVALATRVGSRKLAELETDF